MELPTLKLDSENLKNKVINVLSPLYIDDNTCTKLVAVFEDEIEKGDFIFLVLSIKVIPSEMNRNGAWTGEI